MENWDSRTIESLDLTLDPFGRIAENGAFKHELPFVPLVYHGMGEHGGFGFAYDTDGNEVYYLDLIDNQDRKAFRIPENAKVIAISPDPAGGIYGLSFDCESTFWNLIDWKRTENERGTA